MTTQTDDKTVTIALEEASNAQLLAFGQVLGLDVRAGMNNATLIARIHQADPLRDKITVPAPKESTVSEPGDQHTAVAKEGSIPAGIAGTHWRFDPKVRLSILPSNDGIRAKDVQIACQGEVMLIRRERPVEIPYRHYLVLKNAIETVSRDTDEINPMTGLPVKEWVEQNSYPFQVEAMPSAEEIAAWEKRVSGSELK